MAGYFSNHSQSRFLANSTSTSTTTTTTTTTTTVPNNTSPTTTNSKQPTTSRPHVPLSKHFSTSVSTTSEDKSLSTSKTGHPLRNTWVYWFRQQHTPGSKITNYEEGIKMIAKFYSVETFWSLWTHVNSPSALIPTTDFLLFHSGVRRPVWEDPLNRAGGKWIIRLRKGVADRLWEDLVLAVIGDQFDECGPDERDSSSGATTASDGGEWPEICGCTISVRQNEDILAVWNRNDADAKVKDKVKETIKRALNLPPTIVMEYKSNNDSMQDKSSFRVAPLDRPPLTPTASSTVVPPAAS